MVYPIRLLPQTFYSCIDFSAVARKDLVLIRHTESQTIRDQQGQLKAEEITFNGITDQLHDYSTNLLGQFASADVGWKWPRDSHLGEAWVAGESVVAPVYPEEVQWVADRGCFYLSVPDLFRIPFPVRLANGEEPVICTVLHTPTRGNFWHCSLRWICQGEDVTGWEPKKRKQILKTARNFIIENAQFVQPPYEAVPELAYRTT